MTGATPDRATASTENAESELFARAAACVALQPVSALLADGAGSADILACVAHEASKLVEHEEVALLRVAADGAYVVASSSASPPVGARWTAPTAAAAGAPIPGKGQVRGSLVVTSGRRLPSQALRRLQLFAELVTAAVAYGHASVELASLSDERAALRRIHAVAGRGGTGAEVLAAIAAEASAWMGGGPAALLELAGTGAVRLVADSGSPAVARTRQVSDDLVSEVLRTGEPARADDYAVRGGDRLLPGEDARAAVGVPVVVAGRKWGVFVVGSSAAVLPLDAEHRLTRFTEAIVPTILSAQARTQLANEQLALRRVALLVTAGADRDEVLATVVEQVGTLAPDSSVLIAQREDPEHMRVVAAGGARAIPVGTWIGVESQLVTARLDGKEVTLESLASAAPTTLADTLGLAGWTAVALTECGSIWGVLGVSSATGPLPREAHRRLQQFADLVAAALANARARAEIQALADEQAALRRVAELAARDPTAAEVLGAVAIEALALTGVGAISLLQYRPDGSAEIVAMAGSIARGLAIGGRLPREGDGAVQRLWSTGRPVRLAISEITGHYAELARRHGFETSVAVPITMHGSLWGAMVATGSAHQFPAPIEGQLSTFSELAGTAIAAVQARRESRLLAQEQVALGRVAGLVVRGASLEDVCAALATEASGLLNHIAACLWRRQADGSFVLVAQANGSIPSGARIRPCPGTRLGDALEADGAVRIDGFDGTPIARDARRRRIGPTCVVPIRVEGTLWGKMSVSAWRSPLPADAEDRLQQFAELAGAAIANAENKAKLMTSRARVVATADDTRRRLQRDVHDAAQQRLVHTIIALKLARQAIADGAAPGTLVNEALLNAERASRELRDVVRGILPAALATGGLRAGLQSLLSDLVLPVDLFVTAERCSAHTELTAYFIIAEALTNVVKHARATRATVSVTVAAEVLVIDVRDDGIGGADPTRGTGLLGLVDRVDAVEGSLALSSPPGGGTQLLVRLPLQV